MPPEGLTALQVAQIVGGDLVGPAPHHVAGIASLERAVSGDVSFLVTPRYLPQFRNSRAGIVLVGPELAGVEGGPTTRVVVPDVYAALQKLLPALYPAPEPVWGVHESARIGMGVHWTGRVAIGPHATLGPGSTLGADCVVGGHAVIASGVRIGDNCRIGEATLIDSGSTLGDRVIVHTGARIGTPGFGFTPHEAGHQRVLHLGRCIIERGVEIGVNTTIDRGSFGDTVVGEETKIDNLVHLGHNVTVGKRCLIMAQVGVAGSSIIEDDVILAGQAGIADHLTVGRGARVAAQGGVIGDIPPGTTVSDYPARPHRTALRQAAALRRLTPLVSRLERIARESSGDE